MPGEVNKLPEPSLKFPDGFLWGAATSAFQIEGHPGEITDRLSDWAVWTTIEGKISDKSSADKACEFYTRYPEDLALCNALNLKAFRLSFNWPALCPQEDPATWFDAESVRYYRDLLASIKAQGMSTFVTLFHFCMPVWLADKGGWINPKTADAFAQYAELASKHFGDLIDYWMTHNEPLVYAYYGYVGGEWPPGHRNDYLKAFTCIRYLLEGHARAYHAIQKQTPNARISFAIHWRPFVAHRKFNPLDLLARYLRDDIFNHLFPRAVKTGTVKFPFPISVDRQVRKLGGKIEGLAGTMDYLAINYYTREICGFKWSWPPNPIGSQFDVTEFELNDMGWEMYPEGLYYLLSEDIAPYRIDHKGQVLPIFITENGMATSHAAHLTDGDWSLNDEQRMQYMISHLVAMYKAIEDGVNVKGYLYWSLMDNFEWSHGLKPRFGLVRVSYPTQERTIRNSAKMYADIAAQNGVDWQYLRFCVPRLMQTKLFGTKEKREGPEI